MCCVFKRAVKAAEVTKLVQESLGGDKKKCLLFEPEAYGQQNKKSIWKQNKPSASLIR